MKPIPEACVKCGGYACDGRCSLKIMVVIPATPDTTSMLDNCVDSLKSVHPELTNDEIIVTRGLDGFAKTVNRGVAVARERGADIVVLVNTDILFTVPVLETIRRRFTADPDLGVMGAKLYYPNGLIQHAGGWRYGEHAGHYGYNLKDEVVPWTEQPYFCQFVTGAFHVFRMKVWDQQEGYDERFFLDNEDSLFCYRAWLDEWKVLYEPAMRMVHAEGGTRGGASAEKTMRRTWWDIKRDEGYNKMQRELYPQLDWNRMNLSVWNANGCPNQALVARDGAMGDLVAITPCMDALAKQGFTVSVRTKYPEVFDGNPNVKDAAPDLIHAKSLVIDMNLHNELHPDKSNQGMQQMVDGVDWRYTKPRLFSKTQDLMNFMVREGLHTVNTPFVVMHAARTHWRAKSLPELFWRRVAHRILQEKVNVFVVGGSNDCMPGHPLAVDLRGKTNLKSLRELIRASVGFVGVDSGPLWVAMSTDTHSVGLYTCSSPVPVHGNPPNLIAIETAAECRGCLHRQKPPVFWLECPDNRRYECAEGFNADTVAEAVLCQHLTQVRNKAE